MKHTKEQDGKKINLAERAIKEIGNRLAQMAEEPRGCWYFSWYEPPLPEEIIEEMLAKYD